MKLIVPCCGRSSRFPNLPPKWMLSGADGKPMIVSAIAGLTYRPEDLLITILREHEDRFDATAGLESAFGHAVRTCILDQPTRSQSETVAATLRSERIDEPFLVKDSDGGFTLRAIDATTNYVCVDSLNNHGRINARNKSYVRVDGERIIEIREKFVLSELFNVGGYSFQSPQQFLEYYDRLNGANDSATCEMYLSHVIAAMLHDEIRFEVRRVTDYCDWGTLEDWRRAVAVGRALFVALDGFAFEQGGEFFRPRFSEVRPNRSAVSALRVIAAAGHPIIYMSQRPATLRELTERQMQEAELPIGRVIFDCPAAPWHFAVPSDRSNSPFHGSLVEYDDDEARVIDQIRRAFDEGNR